jgi:hypothetical protein
MFYKGSPSNPDWSGVGGPEDRYQDGPGFVILPVIPPGFPSPLPPLPLTPDLIEAQVRAFGHHMMVELEVTRWTSMVV